MAETGREWWTADPERDRAGEVLQLRLLGFADPARDRRWSVALLVVLVASRLAALPMAPWDQDEAYLALGVAGFDPGALSPHPPWFPLWIVVGKALLAVIGDPARALAVAGAVAGGLMLWPVAALWARVLERRLALLAAALVVAAPGPWLLAARGTTEAPATALLAVAAALWLAPRPTTRTTVLGSLLLGLSLLVRPQLAPAALVLALWRSRRARALDACAPALAVLAVGAVGLVLAAGGPSVLVGAAREHAALHLDGLGDNHYGFASWCVPRALGSDIAGALLSTLAVVGSAALLRRWRTRPAGSVILLALLLPLVVTTSFLQNGTLARYAIPLLALGAGAAVVGAVVLVGRWAPAVAGAGVVALALHTTSALPAATAGPPVTAALVSAEAMGPQVVADDRLHAFVELGRRTGGPGASTVLAAPAGLGLVAPGTPVVRVLELGSGPPPPAAELFRAGHPLLQRLAAGRFVELAVAVADQP